MSGLKSLADVALEDVAFLQGVLRRLDQPVGTLTDEEAANLLPKTEEALRRHLDPEDSDLRSYQQAGANFRGKVETDRSRKWLEHERQAQRPLDNYARLRYCTPELQECIQKIKAQVPLLAEVPISPADRKKDRDLGLRALYALTRGDPGVDAALEALAAHAGLNIVRCRRALATRCTGGC